MAGGGRLQDGTPLLPQGWIERAARPSAASLRAGQPYGYGWWLGDPGRPADMPDALAAFQARGSSGQAIFIHPGERVVVAKWATWAEPPQAPSGKRALSEDDALFAAIVRALH